MMLLSYSHGLRVSEVIHLTADNVRDGVLSVQRLKGSNRTVQPLFENENELLNERKAVFEFTRNMPLNQTLFPITRQYATRLMKRYAKVAGVSLRKAYMHILKHSIAMQLIGTAGIENTRQWLGHKSISSTGEYLKVSDDDAARAVRGVLCV
jgi:site-specific recombinase XerD